MGSKRTNVLLMIEPRSGRDLPHIRQGACGRQAARISGAVFDDVAIGGRSEADADPEEAVECGPEMAPAVPPEDELVEVALVVLAAEAVEYALRPFLQVREYPMDPVEQLVCLPPGDDPGLVGVVREILVADQPIGDDVGIGRHRSVDKAVQRRPGPVRDRLQTDAARISVFGELDCPYDLDFWRNVALARLTLDQIHALPEGHLGLVDLHDILEQPALGVGHRSTELVQQEPGGLVAAEADLRLQLDRRDAVRVAGNDVGRHEPGAQGKVAAVHQRARRHRCLAAAFAALPGGATALQRPSPAAAAFGAHEAIRPAALRKIARARLLVREARVELLARHRPVVGPSCGQMTALRRDGLIRLENNGRTMLCDDLSALRLAAGETALD